MVQVDMPVLLHRTLGEFASLRGTSVEQQAQSTETDEGKKIHKRCSLLKEWQGLGVRGEKAEPEVFCPEAR
jgi:hypothetical protein